MLCLIVSIPGRCPFSYFNTSWLIVCGQFSDCLYYMFMVRPIIRNCEQRLLNTWYSSLTLFGPMKFHIQFYNVKSEWSIVYIRVIISKYYIYFSED